jgi:hypothetical protein
MKTLYFILKISASICFMKLMFFSVLSAQTKIHTNLPRIMKANQPYDFKLSIKGNGTGTISMYELKGTGDISLSCDRIKNARILSLGDRIRIEFGPIDGVTIETQQLNFTISADSKGTFTLSHAVYYANESEDVVRSFNPAVIKVVDASENVESERGFTTINEINTDGTRMEEKVVYSDPTAIKQHLLQLYSDSKEINAVGETELSKAHNKLDNSNLEIRLVEYLNDDHTKKKILGYILMDRKKAMEDIQLARNIIMVGKSLELDAESYKTWVQSQQANWNKDDQMLVKEYNNLGNEGIVSTNNNQNDGSMVSNSIYYRIQVGAFKKKRPDTARFSTLGSVDVVKENGWYKVLIGNYKSKEEANNNRENIVSNGYEAFVAGYLNGKRML